MDEEAVKRMLDNVENEMQAERLMKQGAFAVGAAEIAGTVFTTAVASGVPASLAQEMAADFWNHTIGVPYIMVEESEEDPA